MTKLTHIKQQVILLWLAVGCFVTLVSLNNTAPLCFRLIQMAKLLYVT